MKIVLAKQDSNVLDPKGRPAYSLVAGRSYVVYDDEARKGEDAGALEVASNLDERLPRYAGEALGDKNVIVLFIGGCGDAIVTASCLTALRRTNPEATVDIACNRLHVPLFQMAGFERVIPYPPEAVTLGDYAMYMALEGIDRLPNPHERSLGSLFSEVLSTPPPKTVDVLIPDQIAKRCDLSVAPRPRVAIQVTHPDNVRSYPRERMLQLTESLIKKNVSVYFVGLPGDSPDQLPHSPPVIVNLIGHTDHPAALACVVRQMDAVVCPDSFVMHLAGGLGVPCMTLFGPTNPVLAGDYPSVTPVASGVPCAPCYHTGSTCPQGHTQCIAHQAPTLTPSRLAETIEHMLKSAATAAGA